MPKDAYYFSHDSNARNDQKIIELRSVKGIKGYGIYFCIIEIMREANAYQLPLNFQTLAFDIRELQEDIEDVVLNYDLFVITENGKFFHSDSLLRRMQHLDAVRVKRIKAGKKGGVANAIAKLKQNPSSKVKESKVNEIIKDPENKDKIESPHLLNASFKATYTDFLKMRVSLKKPASEAAQKLILKKLDGFNTETAIKMLERSIESSWSGVFPINGGNNVLDNQERQRPVITTADIEADQSSGDQGGNQIRFKTGLVKEKPSSVL